MFALPIFPGSRPPSIVGVHELNFCVRDGNRWTLMTINTNSYGWLSPSFIVKSRLASNSIRIITLQKKLVNTFYWLFFRNAPSKLNIVPIMQFGFGQHWACFRSSFRLISISQLNTLLHLHPWPINVIVYDVPQWRSYLRESFTLRCFQRLSRPYAATQPCPWQNNWYTRGTSNPVLSY